MNKPQASRFGQPSPTVKTKLKSPIFPYQQASIKTNKYSVIETILKQTNSNGYVETIEHFQVKVTKTESPRKIFGQSDNLSTKIIKTKTWERRETEENKSGINRERSLTDEDFMDYINEEPPGNFQQTEEQKEEAQDEEGQFQEQADESTNNIPEVLEEEEVIEIRNTQRPAKFERFWVLEVSRHFRSQSTLNPEKVYFILFDLFFLFELF